MSYVKSIRPAKPVEFLMASDAGLGNSRTFLKQGIWLRIGRFNSLNNSNLFGTNIGKGSHRKQMEFYFTTGIYGAMVWVDASLDSNDARKKRLFNIREDNFISGFDLTTHMQICRFDLQAGYHNASVAAEGIGRHSYGSLGLAYRW